MCTTQQLLKSHQNLNWNSNVSVSALQNDITLHKKNSIAVIVGWNFLYIMIRHICAWQFLLLLCNHFLGLKSDIYLTMCCQKLSDNPSEFWPYRKFQSKYTKRIPPYLNFNFLDNDHLPLFFRQHFAFQFLPLYSFMVQFRKKGCCCCFDHLMLVLSLSSSTNQSPPILAAS